jgi:hypothetical protein
VTSTKDPSWLPQKRAISDDDWDKFREQYITDLGFSEEPDYRSRLPDSQIFQNETAFLGNNNWPLLMPEDSVLRLRETDRPYEAFKEIVQETAEDTLDGAEPKPLDLYLISNKIITRFKGSSDFDLSRVRDDADFEARGEGGNSVYDGMSVIVTSTNSKNLEDWYVYVVEDATDIFGPTLHSMTQASHSILEAELEPEHVIQDIAFTLEDGGMEAESVAGATPPKHPVSVVTTEPNGDGYYYEIGSTEKTFGDKWGDVDLMKQTLAESDTLGQRIGAGNIGFWVVTGVNW